MLIVPGLRCLMKLTSLSPVLLNVIVNRCLDEFNRFYLAVLRSLQ